MTHRAITLKFVVPEVLAVALGIIISVGVVYLRDKYPIRAAQAEANHSGVDARASAELSSSDGRLSRVHLLLSNFGGTIHFAKK
jgi:hypothetical protein